MKFIETPLAGLWIIEPTVFEDERGFFMETYHKEKFAAHGIHEEFVQQNHSRSKHGVIRGLHYQKPPFEQGKLVRAVSGEVFDVAVDIRSDSKTFGKWYGHNLSGENRTMLYIPPGFAHGFQVLSEEAELVYSCTALYSPHHEAGFLWEDRGLGIGWFALHSHTISEKDQRLPSFTG